jgi:hypothetical protein
VSGLPVLTEIIVTPNSAGVVVGGTQQFTATGYDQYGNVTGINPAWSTNSCGTINGDGLFTGPTVAGQCTVTATDTAVSGSATVNVSDVVNIVDVPVVASFDDAEEAANGGMNLTSSDLEMTMTSSQQTVGMRFNLVDIPADAIITNAFIQFTVDETSSGTTNLTIYGEASPDAATFTSVSGNISGRPSTSASVGWTPDPWLAAGDAGAAQQTTNIATIIEEIVGSANSWASGNSLVIIITGEGKRTAESYNGFPSAAPLLHVEYVLN